jgi:hypothetical protein
MKTKIDLRRPQAPEEILPVVRLGIENGQHE